MGMSIHVRGVVPGDDEWKRAMEAWYACKNAKVEPPSELFDILGLECDSQDPDPNGKVIDLPHNEYADRDRDEQVVEVHFDQVPKEVTSIRFVMSY